MQPTKAFKGLQFIYFALLVGQIFFVIISLFLVTQKLFKSDRHDLENILMPVLVILALICMVSGNKLFKGKLQKLGEVHPVSQRFSEYRAACMVRWALLEGPCIFSIICFLLTSNFLFLVIAALILFIFGSTAPVKNKVAADLGISPEELDAMP